MKQGALKVVRGSRRSGLILGTTESRHRYMTLGGLVAHNSQGLG